MAVASIGEAEGGAAESNKFGAIWRAIRAGRMSSNRTRIGDSPSIRPNQCCARFRRNGQRRRRILAEEIISRSFARQNERSGLKLLGARRNPTHCIAEQQDRVSDSRGVFATPCCRMSQENDFYR
jgi:hypothetical protein